MSNERPLKSDWTINHSIAPYLWQALSFLFLYIKVISRFFTSVSRCQSQGDDMPIVGFLFFYCLGSKINKLPVLLKIWYVFFFHYRHKIHFSCVLFCLDEINLFLSRLSIIFAPHMPKNFHEFIVQYVYVCSFIDLF